MTSRGSCETMRWRSKLSSGFPGTIPNRGASPSLARLARECSAVSRRNGLDWFAESGPWQAKQLFERMGRTWLLKEILSPSVEGFFWGDERAVDASFAVGPAGWADCSGAFLQDMKEEVTANDKRTHAMRFIVASRIMTEIAT